MTEKNIKDPQKKYRIGTVSKIFLLEGLNWFCGANFPFNSDVEQDTKIFGLHEDPLFISNSSLRTYKSRYKKEIKQR